MTKCWCHVISISVLHVMIQQKDEISSILGCFKEPIIIMNYSTAATSDVLNGQEFRIF